MSFGLLDVAADPIEQGFKAYDLIIASNVIHAAKNPDITLVNTRKLLCPGVKFILSDMSMYLCHPSWFQIRDLTRRWLG